MKPVYENTGIYLHIPFCAKPCGYCRFYKKIPTADDIEFYLNTLAEEVELFFDTHTLRARPDTMFVGGGTPSILDPSQIARLAEILERLAPTTEWSVEVSPSTITPDKLEAFKDAGVNRISLGVQSFDETTLKALGRAHTLADTLRAIDTAARANFAHFSLDLIFGAQGQTPEMFARDLQRAASSGVDHISAYCLEFESGTSSCIGSPRGNSDDALKKNESDAELFDEAMLELPSLGFAQYEISNYAKTPAARCLHNLSTWHMAQWIGFGPAAASQFGGRRYRNCPSIKKWADGIKNRAPALEDIVALDDAEMLSSSLIFGLRMNDGVDLDELARRFPNADISKYAPAIENFARDGLLAREHSRIKLTRRGRQVADYIALEFVG